jgi:hypothetical protein
MTVFEDEDDLADCLRGMLAPKFKEVYPNVNLASRKFYADWEKWFGKGAPPAQPEIDLLFVASNFTLLAAELKYYRLSENATLNQPYYSGIDEALALLKFGFTCVSLWHFFDPEVPEETVKRYVEGCRGLTFGLGLRINYEAFRVHSRQDFKQISSTMAEVEPYSLQSPFGASNPLLNNWDAKKAQDFIRKALRIPSP